MRTQEEIKRQIMNTIEKDLFEDFTTLNWVKWTKRKPTHNGMVFMRFNGKNVGVGFVFQGELRKLEGLANSEFKNYEDTFYWQEEIINVEGFRKVCGKQEKIYQHITKLNDRILVSLLLKEIQDKSLQNILRKVFLGNRTDIFEVIQEERPETRKEKFEKMLKDLD